MFCAGILG